MKWIVPRLNYRKLLIVIPFIVFIAMLICYHRYIDVYNYDTYKYNGEPFHFLMAEGQKNRVLNSYREKLNIKDKVPTLQLGQRPFLLQKFTLRGATSLRLRRKSYSIKMINTLQVDDISSNTKHNTRNFKLISMVYDYTYIENRLATLMLHELGLWPVASFLTEVVINSESQGLYMFVEDPKTYFLDKMNAHLLLRRGYHNEVVKYDLNHFSAKYDEEHYLNQFEQIYKVITEYKGEALYNQLSNLLEIDRYMQKMAFDYLVKNGDCTDEIYFYATEKNDKIIFDIFPWDYDDLFSDKPHELIIRSCTGTVFGPRRYGSLKEQKKAINNRPVFSIEDDLDYIIATDDFLYKKYIHNLKRVMDILDDDKIKAIFSRLKTELKPFYENEDIINQSNFDAHPTNRELYQATYEQRKSDILRWRHEVLHQLNVSQTTGN